MNENRKKNECRALLFFGKTGDADFHIGNAYIYEPGSVVLRLRCVANARVSVPTDSRVGFCYRHLLNGRCTNHGGAGEVVAHKAVTKADCCCSMAAAWGPQCQPCPSLSSDAFRQLCLESGYTIDGQGE